LRVVVTGGAGFVGSHVAEIFLERGDEVLVVDDLSSGSRENVPERASFEELDIAEQDALEEALGEGADLVCHLAAQPSVTVSVEDPVRDCTSNVLGTLNVCEAARTRGAPVIFASTGGALYGNNAPRPTPEDVAPEPLSPYGASKLAGEAYVSTWRRLYGMPNVVLRLGNVYGPRQSPHGEAGVVAIFSGRLLAGEAPELRGSGTPTRDYVHVHDIARAFVAAAEARRAGTYNVGTGQETSTARVYEILRRAVGTDLEPAHVELKSGELAASALDSSRIQQELGWRATTDVEEGLAQTLDWYRHGHR
jgi:UDP-glucose 4-epimerase